jgi:hypothetical protein
VFDEVVEGDREAAAARMSIIENIPFLAVNDGVVSLAQRLLMEKVLPRKAARDAGHIAVCAVHGVHFLLTWNCTHLANAEIFDSAEALCAIAGYKCPTMCTPTELLGE